VGEEDEGGVACICGIGMIWRDVKDMSCRARDLGNAHRTLKQVLMMNSKTPIGLVSQDEWTIRMKKRVVEDMGKWGAR
jgi:hypothetical protein